MAGPREIRRGVPLAIKLGGFVAAISLLGATLLGYVGVSATRARIDKGYVSQSAELLEIISAQSLRHPQDFEETNALLKNLVATHPSLVRVRLFRGPPVGPPLVWASSFDTDLAIGTDESILVGPGERQQSESTLDNGPVFLTLSGVEYPNGVETVVFYYEGEPRTQAIAETQRRIITDSLIVIAIQLAALIIATYLIVLKRVRRLGRAAAAVAEGDLLTRVPVGSGEMARDELDEVAVEFDNMTRAVSLRTRQQQAVTEIGRRALAGIELQDLFDVATRAVADVMETEYSLLFEPLGDEGFLLRSAWGVPEGMVGVTTTPNGEHSQAGYTIKSDAPVLVSDRRSETRFGVSELADQLGFASGLTVIVGGAAGQPFGVLGADATEPREFTSDDLTFMQAVANVLAAAIEREAALARERDSERRYRLIVENATDLIILANMEARILVASPSCETTLGYAPEEIVGRSMAALVATPGDEMRMLGEVMSGQVTAFTDLALKHKEGRGVLIDGTVAPIPGEDGSPVLILAIAHDVTEQRAAQEERRRLLARLMAAQESERLRLAADLHDDPIQTMTAAALRLEALRRHSTSPKQEEMIVKLEETIGSAIHRLRRMMFELRPPALDREGLSAALRDYLGSASREHDLAFTFESRLETEPDPETRAVAFRVAKEALVNVTKHARASLVDVLLAPLDDGIRVRIRDDGVGFDAEGADTGVEHIGLSTMRERILLSGGWCQIDSTPGRGTTVEFFVPEQGRTEEAHAEE